MKWNLTKMQGAGIRQGLLDSPVVVHTPGGPLAIAWNDTSLVMTRPATTVFSGRIDIDAPTRSFNLKDASPT